MANHSLEASSSPEHSNAHQDRDEPQRCCVICARTSPKTIFSCRYKVHERNIEILQAFFERPSLRFGELCDRCYRLWYKHKRTKNPPTAANATGKKTRKQQQQQQQQDDSYEDDLVVVATEQQQQQQPPAATNFAAMTHESFHHHHHVVLPNDKHADYRKSSRGVTKKHKQQQQQQHIKIHIIPQKPADFTHCLKALSVMAKPPRKSRRKPTPVRSAPRHDALYEFLSHTSNKRQAAYLLFAARDMSSHAAEQKRIEGLLLQQQQQEPMDDDEDTQQGDEEDQTMDDDEDTQQDDDEVSDTDDGGAYIEEEANEVASTNNGTVSALFTTSTMDLITKEQEQASHLVTNSLLAAAEQGPIAA